MCDSLVAKKGTKKKKKKKRPKRKKKAKGNGLHQDVMLASDFEILTSWWDWLCPKGLTSVDEGQALQRLRSFPSPMPRDLFPLGKEVLSTVTWLRPVGMNRRTWGECVCSWCMVCIVYVVWCMMYGAWCTVYGAWCMVHGVWCAFGV